MTKAREYRDQSSDELQAKLEDLRAELFKLQNRVQVTKKQEKTHLFRMLKKDIARILTILNERRAQLI